MDRKIKFKISFNRIFRKLLYCVTAILIIAIIGYGLYWYSIFTYNYGVKIWDSWFGVDVSGLFMIMGTALNVLILIFFIFVIISACLSRKTKSSEN